MPQKEVTVTLTEHQVVQILSALRNRGDHKNNDPSWVITVDYFTALWAEFSEVTT